MFIENKYNICKIMILYYLYFPNILIIITWVQCRVRIGALNTAPIPIRCRHCERTDSTLTCFISQSCKHYGGTMNAPSGFARRGSDVPPVVWRSCASHCRDAVLSPCVQLAIWVYMYIYYIYNNSRSCFYVGCR